MSDIVEIERSLDKASYALENASYIINKGYLNDLMHYSVDTFFKKNELSLSADIRLYKLDRIVFDSKLSIQESLSAIYSAIGTAGYTVFIYIDSNESKTDLYIGIRGQAKKVQGLIAGKLLEECFNGHFDGSLLSPVENADVSNLLSKIKDDKTKAITSVSGVPSLALENGHDYMQGIERLIDASEGKDYQALILAEPISNNELEVVKLGYELVANQLSPFLKQTLTYGQNDNESITHALSTNISESLGKSVALTETTGTSITSSSSVTEGTNESISKGTFTSKLASGAATAIGAGGAIAGGLKLVNPLVAMAIGAGAGAFAMAFQGNETKGKSESTTKAETTGSNQSSSRGTTDTNTYTVGTTTTDTTGKTTGTSKTMSIESLNKGIDNLLKQIDKQFERIEEARCFGGWHSAAYFFGEHLSTSESLASMYLGLIRGQNSNSEFSALTTWSLDRDQSKTKEVKKWLCNFSHPRLYADFLQKENINSLTPATLISGKEMSVQLGLPRKSTSGTVVIEAQSFGRQIQLLDGQRKTNNADDKSIVLGDIWHLWKTRKQKVALNVNELTKHMFITGSTGSGKSNTTYEILEQLQQNNVPFLVIEPAKGEYKHVFGNSDDVTVYGTNPSLSNLLRINPFAFPESIHVHEHVDRLVEIFNVCWPMYAAMPAVLKEAILDAYEDCGWSLQTSKNKFTPTIYPSFVDVLVSLEKVVKNSDFSEEVKANYNGSLVTRIRSLTNGLNGEIFTSDEINPKKLFDKSCIIDLSRAGASDTKALITGILLVRLNEHRMDEGGMNLPLKHVTVLEEAHNILKATTSAGQEGGQSLESKSVEMLSNSIAEMRTYGEGFIIVDQSPGAVDISAIRNTNTKIIMRLPEENDRRAAGKSIGLKDEQLDELSKLPPGIAVVSQNDWLEPVLCKIKHFTQSENNIYDHNAVYSEMVSEAGFRITILQMLFNETHGNNSLVIPQNIKIGLQKLKLRGFTRGHLMNAYIDFKNGKSLVLLEDRNKQVLIDVLSDIFDINFNEFESNKELYSVLQERINHSVYAYKLLDQMMGYVKAEVIEC
ncbi:ATP-binding protein [Ignatzschineria ureiclastica]|uniref:ATP-binding protein n=1 Tax=Ignatzschineria ureiclastica TaxID=472582 RepID=A0A2U2ACZ9_9GAMM|nr:ATP-binding protein [Ignatzschineria ureiclastica]PWD80439.1 ATP-binding protein [Ignatzschineria ureiclastica]GGZ99507.1 ATP-binding protein [Ignatzschineria ureiclastica]